jgi:hypothetical protein
MLNLLAGSYEEMAGPDGETQAGIPEFQHKQNRFF